MTAEVDSSRRDWNWEDYRLFDGLNEMQNLLMDALAAGQLSIKLELPVLTWLAIVDEIKGRRPKNYSQLLRDDMVERLEAAIERLHDEANFLIAFGPASIASRQPGMKQPTKRDVASAELRRQLRER